MGEHARLSPSAAERWMHCPGSVRLSEQFPEETSIFASEGTAMHTVRERALRSGKDVADFIGEVIVEDDEHFEVTAEWVTWIQPGIDWLREQDGELFVEERVFLDAWMPEQFGTVDSFIIQDDLVIVMDFKGGRGVTVPAEKNMQMMLYALGVWDGIARHKTSTRNFLLIIDQPRVPGGGSEWRTTLDELLLFAERAAAAALATLEPDAPLQPTVKGCQFCRAASNSACYALDQFVLELLGMTLEDLDGESIMTPVPYDKLSPERRSRVIEHSAMIRKWLTNIHGAALKDALNGQPVPGFKAVSTLGDRSWVNEDKAEEYWKSKMPAKEIYTQKLKSPAQMEAVAGTRNWANAQDLIHRPEGNPALVPENDPRPALIPLKDLLDDLDAGDAGDDYDDLI